MSTSSVSTSTMLHVRVESELKRQASETLEKIGLPLSEAIRLFLRRVVVEQALPLDLKVPNEVTLAAMQEAEELFKKPSLKFKTAEGLFHELERQKQ
jgi:DNA-damage-inducible protein J